MPISPDPPLADVALEHVADVAQPAERGRHYDRRLVRIEVAQRATPELIETVKRLLPQLSGSAPPLTSDAVRAMVESECTQLILAKEDDEVRGILMLILFQLPTGLRARLEDLIVDEPVRGQGVAMALMHEGVRLAKEAKARTIDYTARPSRVESNPMYARLVEMGFEKRDTYAYRYTIDVPAAEPAPTEGSSAHASSS